MSEWQPFETAPRDGWFLARLSKYWVGARPPGGFVTATHYSDRFGGEWEIYSWNIARVSAFFDGWMPLPLSSDK